MGCDRRANGIHGRINSLSAQESKVLQTGFFFPYHLTGYRLRPA